MTNEFAIKVLTELRGYGDKFANIGFDRKEALDLAIKTLEQTMWIPVSEGLPKEDQRVLVTDKFEGVTTALYFRESPFWREMVVAWMPTPERYKESEDRNDQQT